MNSDQQNELLRTVEDVIAVAAEETGEIRLDGVAAAGVLHGEDFDGLALAAVGEGEDTRAVRFLAREYPSALLTDQLEDITDSLGRAEEASKGKPVEARGLVVLTSERQPDEAMAAVRDRGLSYAWVGSDAPWLRIKAKGFLCMMKAAPPTPAKDLFKSDERRAVAMTLTDDANRGRAWTGKDLAGAAGVVPSTVSGLKGDLVRLGIVESKGRKMLLTDDGRKSLTKMIKGDGDKKQGDVQEEEDPSSLPGDETTANAKKPEPREIDKHKDHPGNVADNKEMLDESLRRL